MLKDFKWQPQGQASFGGALLGLYQRLDQCFVRLAQGCQAREFKFPSHLPAVTLEKLDYFNSFPHLITMPVTLERSEENLENFRGNRALHDGAISLTRIAPIRHVLTPAACYHFYQFFDGSSLEGPLYLTTAATCNRCEDYYEPLQRQWNFNMREIVCIGAADTVKSFLAEHEEKVSALAKKYGIAITWQDATDPFFKPAQNPKHLAQRLDPVKKEMIFGDGLAIGSVNFHRNYFGEAFHITANGEAAYSGCVAFGLERWMHAVIKTFGEYPKDWPDFA